MAERPHLIAVESATTGGVRAIRVEVDEDARGATIRRDEEYDNAPDCEIAVNLRNTTSNPAGVLFCGCGLGRTSGRRADF